MDNQSNENLVTEKSSITASNEKILKLKKFYNIVFILLIICYLFWAYEFNFCTINIHLICTFILAIPIALIILVYILNKKEKIKETIAQRISIVLIITFLILNFTIVIFVAIEEGTSYEDNPYKYSHIYNISDYKEFTYQFPREISKEQIENDKTRFYYSPQFLQGGFNFELLVEMKNDDMNNYISLYQNKIKKIIDMSQENDGNLYIKYGIYKPYNILKYDETEEFFRECKIYLLESEPYKPYNWNHGYVSYMAKNERLEEFLIVTQVW